MPKSKNRIKKIHDWKKQLKRGDIISIQIPDDKDVKSKQKYRPAIVLKNEDNVDSQVPTLVVQILTTLSTSQEEYKNSQKAKSFKWNQKTQYIKPENLKEISYQLIVNDNKQGSFTDEDPAMQLIKSQYAINDWKDIKAKSTTLTVEEWELVKKLREQPSEESILDEQNLSEERTKLNQEREKLEEQKRKFEEQKRELEKQKEELDEDRNEVERQKARLAKDPEELEKHNRNLKKQIKKCKQDVSQKERTITTKEIENQTQFKKINDLNQENEILKRRLKSFEEQKSEKDVSSTRLPSSSQQTADLSKVCSLIEQHLQPSAIGRGNRRDKPLLLFNINL